MAYSITRAEIPKHKEIIVSLWGETFRNLPEEEYAWRYEDYAYTPPITYLLHHDKSTSPVGFISLYPRTTFVAGTGVHSFLCGNLGILKQHRTVGPAIMLLKSGISHCESESLCVLLGFPSKTALPVMARTGFQVLGETVEMTKVLKSYPYINRFIKIRLIARLVSYVTDFVLRLVDINLLKSRIRLGKYSTTVATHCDRSVDVVWEKIKYQFPLIGDMSSEYLNWRYFRTPQEKFKIFILASKDNKNVLGYIIFSEVEKRAQIVDLAFHNEKSIFYDLIAAFSAYQISMGYEAIGIKIALSPKRKRQFKKCGFSVRQRRGRVVIFDKLEKKILDKIQESNWYFSSGNDV